MKPLKDVTCMVIDHGLFVSVAEKMARDFKRVLYHVPNDDPFPTVNKSMVGVGINGIEVVDNPWDDYNEIDLWFFGDVGFGPFQDWLVEQGETVWGSRCGDELELNRPFAKDILKTVGLPVGKHKVIRGVKNLRSYLKEHKNVFVKVSRWRGSTESFHSPDYKNIEPHLDEMEFRLGPVKDLMEFDVEAELPDRCEVGSDSYCIEGRLPSLYLAGFEVKDAGYCGAICKSSDLPKPMLETDLALAGVLAAYGYRGFYSTEVRVGKDQIPYLIDPTMRLPNPPGFLYSEMYQNFSEIVWAGANGECLDPVSLGKVGVQLQMKSTWSDGGNWQPIDFDSKYSEQVKIVNACKIGDQFYCVPLPLGIAECGSIVGWGDTVDAAIKHATKAADTVGGYSIKINTDALNKASDTCKEAKEKYGIDLGIK
jgi:hypothetical protein